MITTPLLEQIKAAGFGDDSLAVFRATVTRGPRVGGLMKRPPSPTADPAAFGAWHGVRAARHAAQWGSLPNDCGAVGMMLLAPEARDIAAATFDRTFDVARAYFARRAVKRTA